ncbi:MAG: hypothetical protein IPJ38_03615 [Dechloromonas sp.]|uniref:N-acyl amino acid synthase FeeM catalytic core domain-containing protein n=1 Tax=Candidatus Dechloromonas phosphorivorans TaxID=2899244 RepID=A0A935K249_9RHOO|nr:hypothetical protein [Candidatus Dechloromonas phosphorivorans]
MHIPTSAPSHHSQTATVSAVQPKQPDSYGGLLVRPVVSHREEHACHELVRRMYAWRGYLTELASPHLSRDRLTLAAWRDGELAATLTLARDNGSNLMAEALYPAEIAELRSKERIICEYSRLAIDPVTSSTQLMEQFFPYGL